MNRRARQTDYSGPPHYLAANYASRTMRWSGPSCAFFVFFHLADLTWGVQPGPRDLGARARSTPTSSPPSAAGGHRLLRTRRWSPSDPPLSRGLVDVPEPGINHPRFNQWRRYSGVGLAVHRHRKHRHAAGRALRSGSEADMTNSTPRPPRPHRREVGEPQVQPTGWSTPPTSGSSRSSWSAPAWPGPPPPPPSASWVTTSRLHLPRLPRRAHSISAQGGINAAKNYHNDGDSVHRLFYDTSRAATTGAGRPTSTASPTSRSTSSTRPPPRGSPSPASTEASSTTAPSAAPRCPGPSTPGARPASNSCSAPIRR
jgi:hypothetical protein